VSAFSRLIQGRAGRFKLLLHTYINMTYIHKHDIDVRTTWKHQVGRQQQAESQHLPTYLLLSEREGIFLFSYFIFSCKRIYITGLVYDCVE